MLGLPKPHSRTKHALLTHTLGAFALTLALASVLAFSVFGWRINQTPSMPIGIYRITSDSSSKLVAFCLTGTFGLESVQRQYRPSGTCPDGGAPLLKHIVAEAGDQVDVTENGISINGELLPNSKPLTRDSAGRPLQPWPCGHYIIPQGFVWVASTYNRQSYDSRYYGPISITQILYRLKSVFTFSAQER